jgi:6-phosphogluconolactonase
MVTLVDERGFQENERSTRLVRQHLLQNKAAAAQFVPLFENVEAAKALRFDVAVLGMGSDGHTASFFPEADRLKEAIDSGTSQRLIAITAPGAGEPRLTFTLPVLEASGRLALHIEGDDKKHVLDKALADGPEEDMPVRAVLRSATPITLYWCP